MTRTLSFLVAALALAPAAGAQTSGFRTLTVESTGERRVALVIGNAAYTRATPLRNATNDATDVTEALRQAGFTVVTGTDMTQEQMDQSLLEFRTLAHNADAAAFYYAGHGVQLGGENYLLPVDADLSHQGQIRYASMPLGEVMGVLQESQATFKLVMLDACRDNPFASMRSLQTGLANPSMAPSGSLIAYATAPGKRASDNPTGRNGLFTAALLQEMQTPGVEIMRVFRNVYSRVATESDRTQEPWTSGSYSGDFYFIPPGGLAAERPAAPDAPAASISSVAVPTTLPAAAPVSAEALAAAREGTAAFHAGQYGTALPLLTRAAAAGDAAAQTRLGLLYQNGWAVLADPREAVRLYRLAAAGGDAVAEGNLAFMYQHGLGVPANPGEAVRLYRLAVAQGRASAQNNLATMYQNGAGVARDDDEAVRLYRLASEGGLAEATANLAFMIEAGRGAPADCAEALALYQAASAAGDADAGQRAATLMCSSTVPLRP